MLTGSMTTAGAMLGISQPAVSRLIREIEGKVGFALFERQGKKITPTPEAVTLHREVDRSMQALSRIEVAAESIAQSKTDTLRVISTLGISAVYIGDVLRRLEQDFPDATVTLHTGTTPTVVETMLTQQFDLGFGFFPRVVQGLEIEPVNDVEAVCILPKGHALADLKEINVTDLDGVPLICQEKETQTQYKVVSVFRAAEIEPQIRVEANFTLMIYNLVETGLGAAIVEPITAKAMTDRAIEIRPFRPAIRFGSGIAFPTQKPRTDLAQAFAEHFKHVFNADFGF